MSGCYQGDPPLTFQGESNEPIFELIRASVREFHMILYEEIFENVIFRMGLLYIPPLIFDAESSHIFSFLKQTTSTQGLDFFFLGNSLVP